MASAFPPASEQGDSLWRARRPRAAGAQVGRARFVETPVSDGVRRRSLAPRTCSMVQRLHRAPVLVVDDEPDVARGMARILAAGGYEPTYCTTGREALALMRSHPFSILVTDVFIPDYDGCEIIAFARAHAAEMRVVAVSGGGPHSKWDEALHMAAEAGAHATLVKPFSPQQLLDVVNTAIG